MKILVSLFLGLFLFAFAADNLFAQKREITIILLRHAEKDLSDELNDPDPELAPAGKERAERLVKTIGKYKPQAIYSSNFKRTRYTVTPLAERINPPYRTMIQIYDHTKLNELVNRMMASGVRSIVVAGHNSTTPALANLLIKQNKYKSLAENEYDKIWIIRIKKGKVREEVIVY
ncbi:MAG TPA: phosphoglycerate mutase family protein [Pyrinomonadaceae bacterium]|nr:phosphoglycerate mutase family protein [Pyrinomonadaceae bacterium]